MDGKNSYPLDFRELEALVAKYSPDTRGAADRLEKWSLTAAFLGFAISFISPEFLSLI
jgi:hypothetical protein